MALVLDLQRMLLEILSSPAMMEQAEVLRIQTQVEEIRRLLWAINAVILDAQLRVMALKEQDLDDWVADVAATIVDLEDLLTSIIDRHERAVDSGGSSSRSSSFLLPARLAFRVAVLRKLKKMRCRLNGLVERGSAFNLWREPMESMDPFQDGYSAILEDEVKGRRVEYGELVELLQQQQMHPTMKDEEYSSIEISILAHLNSEYKGLVGRGNPRYTGEMLFNYKQQDTAESCKAFSHMCHLKRTLLDHQLDLIEKQNWTKCNSIATSE